VFITLGNKINLIQYKERGRAMEVGRLNAETLATSDLINLGIRQFDRLWYRRIIGHGVLPTALASYLPSRGRLECKHRSSRGASAAIVLYRLILDDEQDAVMAQPGLGECRHRGIAVAA
jgi:hypothetical protein